MIFSFINIHFLTLNRAYKERVSKRKKKESENRKAAKNNEREKVKKNAAIERKLERKQKNFYSRASDIKRALFSHHQMIVLCTKRHS